MLCTVCHAVAHNAQLSQRCQVACPPSTGVTSPSTSAHPARIPAAPLIPVPSHSAHPTLTVGPPTPAPTPPLRCETASRVKACHVTRRIAHCVRNLNHLLHVFLKTFSRLSQTVVSLFLNTVFLWFSTVSLSFSQPWQTCTQGSFNRVATVHKNAQCVSNFQHNVCFCICWNVFSWITHFVSTL